MLLLTGVWLLAVLLLGAPALHRVYAAQAATGTAAEALDDPDRACARCHQAIYARYEQTPKAQGSGVAGAELVPGSFHHTASGVDYRVFRRDGAAWMSYSRQSTDPALSLAGERRLAFFIGSGKKGRTYLYQQGDAWFELPINYYSRREMWAMAPAFDDAQAMPTALPTDPNCLHCHATAVQAELPEARNRFRSVPFRQGGVGCSACHGDPTAHLAAGGHGPIVNPAKLPAARRDSACLQCHLEGDAVVYRPGRSLAGFRAGDDLRDTATYFVQAGEQAGGRRAASQWEALLQSACKRGSGDRLTCTTCHDPHAVPAPAERVAFFRARCLSCHTEPALAVTHHPEQPDCASCHMPARRTSDISHEQTVDHNIQARPAAPAVRSVRPGGRLVAVGTAPAGDRELGMAYAQLAERGDREAGQRALQLLRATAAADDAEAQARLGYLEQIAGNGDRARAAYRNALVANPYSATALSNLGVLDAASGKLPEAVQLLDRLVLADPSQTAAGLDLAWILCEVGHREPARRLLQELLPHTPDDRPLRRFLSTGNYAGQHCSLPGGGAAGKDGPAAAAAR